jgi:hypothetical protein
LAPVPGELTLVNTYKFGDPDKVFIESYTVPDNHVWELTTIDVLASMTIAGNSSPITIRMTPGGAIRVSSGKDGSEFFASLPMHFNPGTEIFFSCLSRSYITVDEYEIK